MHVREGLFTWIWEAGDPPQACAAAEQRVCGFWFDTGGAAHQSHDRQRSEGEVLPPNMLDHPPVGGPELLYASLTGQKVGERRIPPVRIDEVPMLVKQELRYPRCTRGLDKDCGSHDVTPGGFDVRTLLGVIRRGNEYFAMSF